MVSIVSAQNNTQSKLCEEFPTLVGGNTNCPDLLITYCMLASNYHIVPYKEE